MSAVIRLYGFEDPSVLTVEVEQVGDPGPGQVLLRHEAKLGVPALPELKAIFHPSSQESCERDH